MPVWFWWSAIPLVALSLLMCLRSLALYRQREIDQHDLAREVARLRYEYERRMQDRTDMDAVNAQEVH